MSTGLLALNLVLSETVLVLVLVFLIDFSRNPFGRLRNNIDFHCH